jgi:type I restriction enzyme S subunit
VAKVGELLAHVNAAKGRLEKVRSILKRFRQSVLAAACSGRLTEHVTENSQRQEVESSQDAVDVAGLPELPEFPASWKLTRIGEVASRIQYGTSVKAVKERVGTPMLRMGNIQDGRLDLSELKYVRDASGLGGFLLQQGDVLFNRTNSPELVGKSAVFDSEMSALFASYIIRLQVRGDLAHPVFVSAWMNSPWGREWAQRVRTDGVSQSNINSKKLAAMPVPLPTRDEQDQVVNQIAVLTRLADNVEQRIADAEGRCDGLRQSILAKAFAGQLAPTEAELARAEGRDYEPAEVLLGRIRREREEEGSTRKSASKRRTAGTRSRKRRRSRK